MKPSGPELDERRIAYFVSPHGFGHAARAAGVMAAMHEIDPRMRFDIFTTVPAWFFQDSLNGPFAYHSLMTDIGLVQKTPLREDLPRTLERLNDFLPFDHSQITRLAERVKGKRCELIICDIAPIGIAVAQAAGIPSVLVENFTWDWIYQGYISYDRRIGRYVSYLKALFEAADYHIQTEPICCHRLADLAALPISRRIRTPGQEVREKLGISSEAKAVLITMGGTPLRHRFLEHLKNQRDVHFVVPGRDRSVHSRDNLVLLPRRPDFLHPDLVNASDGVIGKGGYSTLAEVYYAGVPFGYITRPDFGESEILAAYIEQHMSGFAISETEFLEGSWVSRLPELLALPRVRRSGPDGASQVAHFIVKVLNRKGAT